MSEKVKIVETVDGVAAAAPESRFSRIRRNSKEKAAGKERAKSDPYIWGIYLALLVFSIIELFSASSTEVQATNIYAPLIRHSIFLALGLGIVLWLQRTHYGYIGRFAWVIGLLSLGLLILSSAIGVEINGAQRAIRIAGITIQPAEIAKLAVVILLSYILGRNQEPKGVKLKGIVMAASVVLIFSACLIRNGMTNTLLLMGVSCCMFLIGGIPLYKLCGILAVYAVCAGAFYMLKNTHDKTDEFDRMAQTTSVESKKGIDRTGTQLQRLKRFAKGVSPDDAMDDYNRQAMLAKFALANGGMIGQGPGNSRESARLPLAFSDYIYSIIVEDTGFVGGFVLMALYLLLLARAGRVAYKCSRAFPAFLILGCAVLIVFQALVHMAIVTGLFPVSGQPLPLISKGGTSVIVMSAAIGIMLSVSRYAVTSGNKKDLQRELRELPEELQAANFSTYNEEKH